LSPSPKWKLVVDVGEPDPVNDTAATNQISGMNSNYAQGSVELSDSTSVSEKASSGAKDTRIDDVVSLLGEFMPSDPNSPLSPYINGFMSLRLLLLRPSRSPDEEERVRTMLDSYSSYSQGGRARSDIGVMLARDYVFICQAKTQQQQQPQQQNPFFSIGQGTVNNYQAPTLPGFSLFDIQNSPSLAPIGIGDTISIIST
jgi:hypothetical protein